MIKVIEQGAYMNRIDKTPEGKITAECSFLGTRYECSAVIYADARGMKTDKVLYAVHRTPGLRRTGWRTFADIWGVILICSTLFVKQHAFIDVVAALVVGAIAYVIIYTIIGGRRDRRMAAAGKEVPCGEHTDP